jgi:hypothetical protein
MREFARWRKYQCPNFSSTAIHFRWVKRQAVQCRERKRGRFAGPRLGASQYIATFENWWNRRGLDFGGGRVTFCLHSAKQCFGEAEISEIHQHFL